MDCGRRQFLRKAGMVAGAAAVGAMADKLVAGSATAPTTMNMDMPGHSGMAMTVDHQLVPLTVKGQPSRAVPGPLDPAARAGVPGRKWVMVIDLAKCDGCGHCMTGCGKMHDLPPDGRQWIKVLRMRESPHAAPFFMPQPCFHCDNPPCTKVCPVDATYKRQDGTVLVDNDRCIGCRFCMAACPYGVRVFNWATPDAAKEPAEAATEPYSPERGYPRKVGTVEKCDFCPDMGAMGMLPGCASACPMGVIYYGDQNEDAVTNGTGQTVRLSSLLRDNAAYRYMEELGTEPRVYYLPPKNRLFPGPAEGGHL